MLRPNSSGYAPAIASLLRQLPLAPLGPGTPERSVKTKLESLDDAAFGGRIADQDLAAACRAALWLAFNFLDESHAISQGLHTAEGSYWHGLMHRREPDHSNAAYWFRKVGTHSVFEPLRVAAAELAASAPPDAAFLRKQSAWDPFALNDLCEANRKETAPCNDLCRQVQRAEWELLFDYCYRRAVSA